MDDPYELIESENGHIPGTSSSFFYTSETLKMHRSIPSGTASVFGLGACKMALINAILAPKCAPQHFIIGDGFLPVRRTLMFYGAKSSGKKTLIKTFCAEQNINLIISSYAGFEPLVDMPIIFRRACAAQPCILLFDDCVAPFRQNQHARNIGIFHACNQLIDDSQSQVWSIFTTVEKPAFVPSNPESLHHAFFSALRMKVWSGDNGTGHPHTRTTDLLSEAERLSVFVKAIGRYYKDINGKPPLTQEELLQLVEQSAFCTVGNIINFVDSVFLSHSDRMGISDLVGYGTNNEALLPPFHSFEQQITQYRRFNDGNPGITPFRAYDMNLTWYSPAFEPGWE